MEKPTIPEVRSLSSELSRLNPNVIARMHGIINAAIEHEVNIRMEHIEMMATAYLLKTDIPPDEVELVEEQVENRVIWYFRRREVEK
jgi:Trk K+ transport system NAD-binding subunit